MIKRTIVNELPAELPLGAEVYLNDNGRLTKYVGNADDEPYPAKGYQELSVYIGEVDGGLGFQQVLVNDFGTPVFNYSSGTVEISAPNLVLNDGKFMLLGTLSAEVMDTEAFIKLRGDLNTETVSLEFYNEAGAQVTSGSAWVNIRTYPE